MEFLSSLSFWFFFYLSFSWALCCSEILLGGCGLAIGWAMGESLDGVMIGGSLE